MPSGEKGVRGRRGSARILREDKAKGRRRELSSVARHFLATSSVRARTHLKHTERCTHVHKIQRDNAASVYARFRRIIASAAYLLPAIATLCPPRFVTRANIQVGNHSRTTACRTGRRIPRERLALLLPLSLDARALKPFPLIRTPDRSLSLSFFYHLSLYRSPPLFPRFFLLPCSLSLSHVDLRVRSFSALTRYDA